MKSRTGEEVLHKIMFNRNSLLVALTTGALLLAVACTSSREAPATGALEPNPAIAIGRPDQGNSMPISASRPGLALSSSRSVAPAGGYDTAYSTSYGLAYQASSYPTGIVVTGMGRQNIPADTGIVHLGIEARGKTVAVAREDAAQAITKMRDAIKALGIAEKDIVTSYFNIQPETVWVEVKDNLGTHGQPKIIGYVVTNQVEVTVKKIDDVGRVVDAAADKGGDLIRINSISFIVGDPSAYAISMRELAAKDAKAKAEVYAKAMGVKLGALVYLTEQQSSAPVMQKDMQFARAMASESAPTPISPGEIDLTTTITAVFSIAP